MSEEIKKFVIGVQAIYIRRPDGIEEQLIAAQDAQISGKITQVMKSGDDAIVPLAVINSAKEVKISGKHAKTSLALMTYIMGGTKTQVAANSFSAVQADTADCSMKNAIVINGVGVGALVTDIYTFMARGSNSFVVVRSSDGATLGTYTTASYPRTDIIVGLSITVNGTLNAGSYANIKTAAIGQTVEIKDEDSNDVPVTLPVRVITEPSDDGQFEILFYACKSAGTTWSLKSKNFGEIDFEFQAFVEPTLGKIAQWRTRTTPAASSC